MAHKRTSVNASWETLRNTQHRCGSKAKYHLCSPIGVPQVQFSAPPKNWKELVNRAERFHIVGVWAAVLAFAFFLIAVALKLAVH